MGKIHRKYPERNWEFKAISTRIEGRDVIYYTLTDNGKKSMGVEIYGGKNYIVGSDSPSYSRRYLISAVPKKYKKVVKQLQVRHRKTKWSKKPYVNLN